MGCEVKKALFDMDPFKAPAPDGFQALLSKTLGPGRRPTNAVMRLVLNVLDGQGMLEGFNHTVLAVVSNPQSVTQLRPIGLCNMAYKVTSKVLVNRIKPVFDKLIASMQSSFIIGRQITDSIVIVQEMLHLMRRSRANSVTWL